MIRKKQQLLPGELCSMVEETREQLAQDLEGFAIDPCEAEAEKCSKSIHNLIEAWCKAKGNIETAAAAALKGRLVDGDVDDVIGSVEFSKLSRAILVELRITMSMIKKKQRRIAQLKDKKVAKALKGALEEALQQLKGEAAALKKTLASVPEAISILKKARDNLVRDCKTFVVSPGEKTWKECTACLGMLVGSWAAVRGTILAAVEELRGKARDIDLLGGTTSTVVLAQLLRGTLSELLVLMKALGEMQEQMQGMEGVEGVTKVMAEAALKKVRGKLKAMMSELKEMSAEQVLQGAELQQLRAEAAVDAGAALLDFADIVLSGVSIVPGLGGVCAVLKSVVGAGRNVHELAEDALKMTESALEIGRYLIDMERLAMRMKKGRKAELQYHMSSLSELVGDMQEAIKIFGKRGVITKMLTSAKLVRLVTTIERRKNATLKAMDRILQTVQTELMLDAKDRVQLETKEHTYALAEAVWAKIEQHTKVKGGDVDVDADVSEAAWEIMRVPSALKEVADSAGLSEEVFKEEITALHEKLEELRGVVQEAGEHIQNVAIEEHAHTRENAWQVAAEVAEARLIGAKAERDYLLQRAPGPKQSVDTDGLTAASNGAADTVGVFCCHIPHIDSHSSEVAGASRVEGERKVLATTEGARILLPASIESMEDAIAEFNPRGVHIAGHNQVICTCTPS
jgi:hypothetical protein